MSHHHRVCIHFVYFKCTYTVTHDLIIILILIIGLYNTGDHNLMTTFMDDSDDERPHKRRLVEQDTVDILSGLLHEEVDVEIGLRERLSQTAEYRLTWALVLRNALALGESFEQSEARNGLSMYRRFFFQYLHYFMSYAQ